MEVEECKGEGNGGKTYIRVSRGMSKDRKVIHGDSGAESNDSK